MILQEIEFNHVKIPFSFHLSCLAAYIKKFTTHSCKIRLSLIVQKYPLHSSAFLTSLTNEEWVFNRKEKKGERSIIKFLICTSLMISFQHLLTLLIRVTELSTLILFSSSSAVGMLKAESATHSATLILGKLFRGFQFRNLSQSWEQEVPTHGIP